MQRHEVTKVMACLALKGLKCQVKNVASTCCTSPKVLTQGTDTTVPSLNLKSTAVPGGPSLLLLE